MQEWYEEAFTGLSGEFFANWLQDLTPVEADFIEAALDVPKGSEILDVPCGAGRLALALDAKGYSLTGFDLSKELLFRACKESIVKMRSMNWEWGDMRDLHWNAHFDAAFCCWGFGYFDDTGNQMFLHEVARALKPGGKFLLDTRFIAEAFLPTFNHVRLWDLVGDIYCLAKSQYDLLDSRFKPTYTYIKGGEMEEQTLSVRVYSFKEIFEMLNRAGLEVIAVHASPCIAPFTHGSTRAGIVAQKRADNEEGGNVAVA